MKCFDKQNFKTRFSSNSGYNNNAGVFALFISLRKNIKILLVYLCFLEVLC
jgi:hypothetical protein